MPDYKITVTETVTYQSIISIPKQDNDEDVEQLVVDTFYNKGYYDVANILDSETSDIDIEPMNRYDS